MKNILVTTSWDDGHKLDLKLARLLKKYQIAGTFYIAPQDHEFETNDRLTTTDIRKLANDFEIGAHTMTHPRLTSVDDMTAEKEINDSKTHLEKIISRPVTSFCYPAGAFLSQHEAMVKNAGFKLARTVKRFRSSWTNNFEMPTSIHTYRHWSDAWQIAKTARFDPFKFVRFLLNWDQLAIEVFDQTALRGGVFHIWGHSWEIDRNNDWKRLETVFAYIEKCSDQEDRVSNNYFTTKRQPKLLLSAPYFYPKVGGLEVYAYEMALSAQKAGYEVVVITSGSEKTIFEEVIKGIHIYRLPVQRILMSNTPVSLKWPKMIKRIIAVEQPDVINAHMPVPYLSEIVVRCAGRIPTIVTYHSASLKKGKPVLDQMISVYERLVLAKSFKRANHIVCSSDFIRHGFLKKYAYKSLTITPGVHEKQFVPKQSSTEAGKVLFIGDFRYGGKGLEYLVQAVAKVPEAHLRVVGSGDQIPATRVSYAGVLGRDELVKEIQSSSIVVLPSINPSESFGMVLIEAMACGVAVIGSDIGGIRSVIKHSETGLLVPPGDVRALSSAIKSLLNNSDLRLRLAAAGHTKVLGTYTWQRQTNRFIGLCENLNRPYVVHVTPYYPPHLGGMENVVKELASEMSKQYFPVRVVTSNIGVDKLIVTDDQGVVVDRLHAHTIMGLPILWTLPFRLLFTPKPDVVHVHVAQAFTPEVALLVARLRRVPVVMHFHLDVSASGRFGFIFNAYKKYILGMTLRGASSVVAFSTEQRAVLQQKYRVPFERIRIVPNGISEVFLQTNPVRRLLPTSARKTILYVGRLAPQKRVERLVEAMGVIRTKVQLVIVGDGSEREKLVTLARRLKLTNVVFVGRKNAEEIKQYHASADIFAICSDGEGMPLVALEAMASGLPVVGSDVTGIRELVGGVGMLVKDPTPENFAHILDELLAEPKTLEQLSYQSIKTAQKYTWPKIVTRLAKNVYSKATI